MNSETVLELYRIVCHWASLNPSFNGYLPITQSQHHVCTRECRTLSVRNHFVCIASGRLHTCEPEHCPLMFVHTEGRSCPISGYLDRTEVYNESLGDQLYRCTRSLRADNLKRKREEAKLDKAAEKPLHTILETIRELCVSEARYTADAARKEAVRRRVSTACRRYLQVQISRSKPVELLHLVSVVSNESYSPTQREPLDRNSEILLRYARMVLMYWNQLQPYVKNPKYVLVYHTLATLYALKQGILDHSDSILDRRPDLDQILPHINDVDAIGFKKRKLTRHLEMFRKAFVLYHRQQPSVPRHSPKRPRRDDLRATSVEL